MCAGKVKSNVVVFIPDSKNDLFKPFLSIWKCGGPLKSGHDIRPTIPISVRRCKKAAGKTAGPGKKGKLLRTINVWVVAGGGNARVLEAMVVGWEVGQTDRLDR